MSNLEKEHKDNQDNKDENLVSQDDISKNDKKGRKQLRKSPFKVLGIAIAIILVLSLIAMSQLIYISVSIEPKWIVDSDANGISFIRNPKLAEIRAEEIEAGLALSVAPAEGAIIPVEWGDLGKRLVEDGVIDKDKFLSLYEKRGGLGEYEQALLLSDNNKDIVINSDNSNFVLNLLWAFGLANKNKILEEGPMTDDKYGGDPSKFASTGGWTMAKGNTMTHYSKHSYAILNEEQQKLVEEVTKNIYRPCCGNSTHFPDCNHGMAMLGLMELMASQGATEQEMYDTALKVNSFWFPSTYMTIGKYFAQRGVDWSDVDAKQILGSMYSSSQGYAQIAREVEPVKQSGGGSCGV